MTPENESISLFQCLKLLLNVYSQPYVVIFESQNRVLEAMG